MALTNGWIAVAYSEGFEKVLESHILIVGVSANFIVTTYTQRCPKLSTAQMVLPIENSTTV